MTHVPSATSFALLALAAYRVYRLIAKDTITEPVRDALSYPDDSAVTLSSRPTIYEGHSSLGLSNPIGDDRPKTLRIYVATLLRCPWCMGFYVSVGTWLAWFFFPRFTLVASVPFALSAAVALLTKNLDKETGAH